MCSITLRVSCLKQDVEKLEHKKYNTMTYSTFSLINEQRGQVTKRLNKDAEHHREVRQSYIGNEGQKVVVSETK